MFRCFLEEKNLIALNVLEGLAIISTIIAVIVIMLGGDLIRTVLALVVAGLIDALTIKVAISDSKDI